MAKKILISAGPTREKIDLVRFISNFSSGKMGYAIAKAAQKSGYQVTLVSGPVNLPAPDGVELIKVESAAEMAAAILPRANEFDVIIMTAAVADFRPKQIFQGKIKKGGKKLTIELEPTTDILFELGKQKSPGQILIGFAAENDNLIEYAKEKLTRKNLDFIAANIVDGSRSIGFSSDDNKIILVPANRTPIDLGFGSKELLAQKLLEACGL